MDEPYVYLFFICIAIIGGLFHLFKKKDWESSLKNILKAVTTAAIAGLIPIGLGIVNGPMFHGELILMGLAIGYMSDSLVSEFMARSGMYLPDITAYKKE